MGGTMTQEEAHFPEELTGPVSDFHAGLTQLGSTLTPLLATKRSDLTEKLEPLAQAKVDLVSAYAINSLVWMWMRTRGDDPKESEVKTELDRVKSSMVRLKEIQDKSKRPNVNLPAAKRMVTSGLWNPGEEKLGKEPKSKVPQAKADQPRAKRSRK